MRKESLLVALFAFSGGLADASSMLRYNTFTGHITGNLVLLTMSLAARRWTDVLLRAVAVVCFALCTAAGSRLARQPMRIFAAQTVLILLACSQQGKTAWPELLGVVALCCSLGLQNGAFTSAAGVPMHSTFVSGDLTSLIRRLVQPEPPTAAEGGEAGERTLRVLTMLLLSFVAGALAAALLSEALGVWLPCLALAPLGGAAMLQMQTQPGAR